MWTKCCIHQNKDYPKLMKDIIQIHVFLKLLFFWIVTLEASIWKTELDGMFIFRCWFFENFSFWPLTSADLQDNNPIPKSEFAGACIFTSPKLGVCFHVIMCQFMSERINFETLFRLEKWCYLDQHSSHGNTKHTS